MLVGVFVKKGGSEFRVAVSCSAPFCSRTDTYIIVKLFYVRCC